MTVAVVLTGTARSSAKSAGPYYSNTIHQSAGGRDSRGFPKYYERRRFSGAYAGAYSPAPQRDFQLQGRGLGE
jgi:hypothetical protein